LNYLGVKGVLLLGSKRGWAPMAYTPNNLNIYKDSRKLFSSISMAHLSSIKILPPAIVVIHGSIQKAKRKDKKSPQKRKKGEKCELNIIYAGIVLVLCTTIYFFTLQK
jgi:hypothetical protein